MYKMSNNCQRKFSPIPTPVRSDYEEKWRPYSAD